MATTPIHPIPYVYVTRRWYDLWQSESRLITNEGDTIGRVQDFGIGWKAFYGPLSNSQECGDVCRDRQAAKECLSRVLAAVQVYTPPVP